MMRSKFVVHLILISSMVGCAGKKDSAPAPQTAPTSQKTTENADASQPDGQNAPEQPQHSTPTPPTPLPSSQSRVLSAELSWELWDGFGVNSKDEKNRGGHIKVFCNRKKASDPFECGGFYQEDEYLGYLKAENVTPLIPDLVSLGEDGLSAAAMLKVKCARKNSSDPICEAAAVVTSQPPSSKIFLDRDGVLKKESGEVFRTYQREEASKICAKYGLHLPTARELAELIRLKGARGIIAGENDDEFCKGKKGCRILPVNAIDPDGKYDSFYINLIGYDGSKNDWSKNYSIFLSSSNYQFDRDRPYVLGSEEGVIMTLGGFFAPAVRCISRQ